jgi:hypothetical protein
MSLKNTAKQKTTHKKIDTLAKVLNLRRRIETRQNSILELKIYLPFHFTSRYSNLLPTATSAGWPLLPPKSQTQFKSKSRDWYFCIRSTEGSLLQLTEKVPRLSGRKLARRWGWIDCGPIHTFSRHGSMEMRLTESTSRTLFIPQLINPLNAELNPICHLLILLGDLTFMGKCIVSISNKM